MRNIVFINAVFYCHAPDVNAPPDFPLHVVCALPPCPFHDDVHHPLYNVRRPRVFTALAVLASLSWIKYQMAQKFCRFYISPYVLKTLEMV